ncbi:hypothetical protein [Bacillus suaedae]|uniref:Uncharacterized protein n=1 Tax=Halalkalibacter suaedae TaxID=2822140 RepID=A0A940WYN7_9BACI|nr:hypothetical protein [Bacillus suaedae]MBP3953193.1 hypothetical protein [Bacillus suaedae]
MIYFFLLLLVLSIFFAIRLKKPLWLSVPFAGIIVYFIIQISMVPLGFFETLKFIFSLR